MSQKCNIISFGKLDKYYLLIIFAALILLCDTYVEPHSKFFEEESPHKVECFLTYPLGLCLSFFLLLFFNIYNKRKKTRPSQLINNIKVNSNFALKRTSKIEQFLWMLLISFFDFFGTIIYFLNFVVGREYFNFWSVNIITFSLFSHLILKVKLYKHHYICIIIVFIFGILFDVILNNFSQGDIFSNLMNYLTETLFSLSYVICKYIMLNKFIKSYALLFYEGLIELTFGIITLIILNKYNMDNFNDFLNDLDTKEIIIYISLTLLKFLYNFAIISIINLFSPFHVILTDILSELIKYFIDLSEKDVITSILTIIFILICLFAILVFTEIIELNFLGLSYMIKKNIELRAQLDTLSMDIKDLNKNIIYKGYYIDFNKNNNINNNDEHENENELVYLEEKPSDYE